MSFSHPNSDLINIPAVAVFGIIHRFDDGFTFGQSFWFAVCSTFVSTATNITIIIDYVTTKDFATSGEYEPITAHMMNTQCSLGSGLTSKQRSLVIIVMVLLSYISLGSFIESKLLDLPFLDALYFSVVTIETIGKFILKIEISPNFPQDSAIFTLVRQVLEFSPAFILWAES